MESNEIVREPIFKIIKNQIRDNKPPETKKAYNKLRKQGVDDIQTKQMLAHCMSIELFEMLKFSKPYNRERYVKNLNNLPKDPSD